MQTLNDIFFEYTKTVPPDFFYFLSAVIIVVSFLKAIVERFVDETEK